MLLCFDVWWTIKGRALLWDTLILYLSLSYDTQQSCVTVQINHSLRTAGLLCLLQSLCSLISYFFFHTSIMYICSFSKKKKERKERRIFHQDVALKKKNKFSLFWERKSVRRNITILCDFIYFFTSEEIAGEIYWTECSTLLNVHLI